MKAKKIKAVLTVPAINGGTKIKKKNKKVKLGSAKIKKIKESPTKVDVAMKDKTATTPTLRQHDMPVAAENKKSEKNPSKKKGKKEKGFTGVDVQKLTPAEKKKQDLRTIFVGNVSTKVKRRDLHHLFVKYGKIESVRLRSAPVADPNTSKKASIITGKFHEKRSSLCAYVQFSEENMVEAALKVNGNIMMGKHLQVDRATPNKRPNHKLAVFVGNLIFDVEEEDLRSHFIICGDIQSVRIIRDKKLSVGKGFGYVNFMSEDAVELALQLHGKSFMGRQLRVQRCHKKPKMKVVKQKVQDKPGKMKLGFKAEKTKGSKLKMKKLDGNFTGKKMMASKEFKKIQKMKGKVNKGDKKKSVARQLTGVKPKVKKTT